MELRSRCKELRTLVETVGVIHPSRRLGCQEMTKPSAAVLRRRALRRCRTGRRTQVQATRWRDHRQRRSALGEAVSQQASHQISRTDVTSVTANGGRLEKCKSAVLPRGSGNAAWRRRRRLHLNRGVLPSHPSADPRTSRGNAYPHRLFLGG